MIASAVVAASGFNRWALTVGSIAVGKDTYYGYSSPSQSNAGSISHSAMSLGDGTTETLKQFYWGGGQVVYQTTDDNTPSNTDDDAWHTLIVDGTEFARSSASYGTGSGHATWTFSSATNPFGTTTGAVLDCEIQIQ